MTSINYVEQKGGNFSNSPDCMVICPESITLNNGLASNLTLKSNPEFLSVFQKLGLISPNFEKIDTGLLNELKNPANYGSQGIGIAKLDPNSLEKILENFKLTFPKGHQDRKNIQNAIETLKSAKGCMDTVYNLFPTFDKFINNPS